jgi:tetratricopeptide (TPR) repeat protein
MKDLLVVMLIAFVAMTGCGKKETPGTMPVQAKQLMIEGNVYLKQGDVRRAVENFAAAIKEAPENFEGYYLLSETLVRLKQYPQAISVLGAASNQFPDNGVVFFLMAVAYEGSGNLTPAIVSARKSLDLFIAKRDEEGAKRSSALLAGLVEKAKAQSADAMVKNAESDANNAVDLKAVVAAPVIVEPAEVVPSSETVQK